MTVAGHHVIDCHHHVGSLEAHGISFGDADDRDPVLVDYERRIRVMDRQGVDQAILIPGHGYLRPDGVADTRRVNDAVAAYRDRDPGRFPAALGVAEPLHGVAGIAELSRMKHELGFVGFSVHARFQGCPTDSPLVMALVASAAELGLVPFIHAIDGVPDEAIWRVQQVARSVPDTTIVVVDAFSGLETARQAVIIGQETPNLVFDTSLTHHPMLVEAMIRAVGAERILFGTDYYSMMPRPLPSVVLDEIAISDDLPEQDKAAILAGNVRRVFGLE